MATLYDQFEQLVDEAILDGYNSGLELFMENIEAELQNMVAIEESGGIENVIESVVSDNNTLKKLLRR